MKTSRAATALLDHIADEVSGPDRAPRRRALRAVRRAVLRVTDPAVTYTLDGTSIVMPLSHDLSINRAYYPQYSSNLGLVARATAATRSLDRKLHVIDIGANVGDSVAIIEAQTPAEVLCIEGDPVFLPYLEANAPSFGAVEVERCYIASADVELAGTSINRSAGTARLVEHTTGDESVPVRPISEITERHPNFAVADLVKIDTDGHDVGIIRAMSTWIRHVQPVIFFEYDPTLTRDVSGQDPSGIFAELATLGYPDVVIYDNIGDIVGTYTTGDPALSQMSRSLGTASNPPYWDIVAVPSADRSMLDALSE